jgi:biopolymer transport protein ExbB
MLESEALLAGGYVMLAIFGASIAGLTEILFCFALLRRPVVLPKALVAIADGEVTGEEAAAACRKRGGPFAEVLLAALEAPAGDPEEAQTLVEGAGRRAAHTLSRGVMVLEVVAAIAPLLGLLGTVIGMHEVFSQLGEAGGRQVEALSSGIGKALITTIAGLIVGIPAYIFYSVFSRRVDDLVIDMERYAAALLARRRTASAATIPGAEE